MTPDTAPEACHSFIYDTCLLVVKTSASMVDFSTLFDFLDFHHIGHLFLSSVADITVHILFVYDHPQHYQVTHLHMLPNFIKSY